MKKIALIFVLLSSVLFELTAQDRLPDLKRYFMLANELKSPIWDFSKVPLLGDDPADNAKFSNLTGNLNVIDSYLEFALITYYSAAEKPWAERGNSILPLNNPRLVDRQLGAYVYKGLLEYRFLGDTAAAGRHDTMLKFITDRGNVTRAEVETFYRNNIRSLIGEAVDEEFNKISFRIARHNATLTRNPQNGEYVLSYGGVNTNEEIRTVKGDSLDALSYEMRNGKNKADFTPADLDTVKVQAARIPAVALSDAALSDIKTILTNFYTNPNVTTYNAVKEVYVLFVNTRFSTGKAVYELANRAYIDALAGLHSGLARKVLDDNVRTQAAITTLTREQQQRLVGLRD